MREPEAIEVIRARVHNLRGVSCSLPRGRLSVVTGPSGSGKSSLVFDTIWAEAQRRYTESLPSYVRQVLGVWEKPDVDRIEGLSPAIALDARPSGPSPRSTVGTASEVYDYLRLLFSKAGVPHCSSCGDALDRTPREEIIARLLALPEGTKVVLTAPVGLRKASELPELWGGVRREGFLRILLGDRLISVDDEPPADAGRSEVAIVVDRLTLREGIRQRLAEGVETAIARADGLVGAVLSGGERLLFSERFRCGRCGVTFPEFWPASFSFNNPRGACPHCKGVGTVDRLDEEPGEPFAGSRATPPKRGRGRHFCQAPCPECGGARLRKESLAVKVLDRSIHELVSLPIERVRAFFERLSPKDRVIEPIRREIVRRLDLLIDLGLSYVSLGRSVPTLSAGEHQRLRLATQIGANLAGILYVLDEPTVGLHPAETEELIRVLKGLCDRGNTVVIVEHDLAVVRAADHVVDLGPGAGPAGGTVVAAGTPEEIAREPGSMTGRYLAGERRLEVPRRVKIESWIEVKGAAEHNLKGIDARFPLNALTCVTGVSGSGKSTLVVDILYRALARRLHGSAVAPGAHRELRGDQGIKRAIAVDQSPVGRTPRSNPATYTGLFAPIRSFFAMLPLSRMRGYGADRFSFNSKGGRCEACQGEGVKRVSMHFLPDVLVPCEMCGGRRFNAETLDVRYRGLSIADVLELTVREAGEVFGAIARVAGHLRFLEEIGLGYLELGQRADTLSGGEAQRLKLSRELARRACDTLYVLDEPTTGLHVDDVGLLVRTLRGLVGARNTVVVIEHNLDLIAQADYVIDMGPGGGEAGGTVVVEGTPERVARSRRSATAAYLGQVLQ